LGGFVDNFGQFQTKMLESFALGVWQGWRTPMYLGPLPSRAKCGCTGKGLSFSIGFPNAQDVAKTDDKNARCSFWRNFSE